MSKRIYFDYLDSLRFFAFFVVFVAHASILFPISEDWFYAFYRSVISNGSYGVNFFFILSGFLISYLLLAEKREVGTISIRTFYLKRVLRIWPLYFVVYTVAIFILPVIVNFLGANYMPGDMHTFPNLGMKIGQEGPWWFLFFVGNFYRAHEWGPTPFALGVLWSVCVEEQFYLFWPWIIKKFNQKWMLYTAIFVFFISLIYKAVHINDANLAYYGSLSVAMDLATGCILGLLYFNHEKEVRGWRTSIFNLPKLFIHSFKGNILQYIFTSIFALTFVLYLSLILTHGSNGLIYDTLRLLKRSVLDIIFALILLMFLLRKPRELNESPNTDMSTSASAYKAVESSSRHAWYNRFTYLGRISYGLYAYHAIFLILILAIFNHLGMGPNDVTISRFIFISILSFILTVTVSHYSYKYMEGPCIRLKSKIAKYIKT